MSDGAAGDGAAGDGAAGHDSAEHDSAGTEASFGMTDLEEALRDDPDGAARAAVVARIEGALARVQDELRRGVPPSHFERTRQVFDALATARTLMIHSRGGR